MGIRLQMLHALMEAHPDRAERLRAHVLALETSIDAEPGLCLHRVRTLFEAVHETIAPRLGVDLGEETEFHTRNSRIIKALDFSLPGHPKADKINATIKKLLGAINGTASALAELSNIPNLRHGGSLDWSTLERRHAIMLGGLCDTLASFLFEIAWSRDPQTPNVEVARYEDFERFNAYLDDEHAIVEVAGSQFQPSLVLFQLDRTQYDLIHQEWAQEAEGEAKSDEAAA
jgi:hypothetical protein